MAKTNKLQIEFYNNFSVPWHLTPQEKGDVEKINGKFEDVLWDKKGQTYVIEHKIHTTSERPIKLPPYCIPRAYYDEVRKELEEMAQSGNIKPSHSEWFAPIVITRKKDGKIRLHRLNSVTPMDLYPIPKRDELN